MPITPSESVEYMRVANHAKERSMKQPKTHAKPNTPPPYPLPPYAPGMLGCKGRKQIPSTPTRIGQGLHTRARVQGSCPRCKVPARMDAHARTESKGKVCPTGVGEEKRNDGKKKGKGEGKRVMRTHTRKYAATHSQLARTLDESRLKQHAHCTQHSTQSVEVQQIQRMHAVY